ncbi:transglycosylase SLT domain-containing protein [Photobacterium sp. SDRW27]|uniref:transglycosylase SLT domain-containing protein n=1 Tax=Photobacterium obscurum TaxID=2829490 RepID=UPI0022439595|nr:transglycosylase SLT domain-containing protein [Photobacterium obscurum]MCW8331915.1 transglycosylase SLT domain-containing protein [Photobacterium obscurum]
MKLSNLALCCGLLLSAPSLYANDPFSELDASIEQLNQPQAQKEAEFREFAADYLGEYESWRTEYLKEFDQFRAEVIAKWGDGEVSVSHKSVDYSDTKDVRTIVDYASNEATVAILVEPNLSAEAAQQKIQQMADKLLSNESSSLAEALGHGALLPDGKVVENQVSFSEQKEKVAKNVIIEQTRAQLQEIDKESESLFAASEVIDAELVEEVAVKKKQALLAQTAKRLESVEQSYDEARSQVAQLTQKKIVEYRIQLPANGLGKRAAKFVDYAEKESERFDIPAALVMAIMHSESSFNPRAKSPIPAYGLMQIVPTTAGRDVNARVRKIDEPMRPNELYMAEVNVETGTAYLNILDKSYLKTITDEKSRLYCTIAAYNTGAGNVAKAFNADGSRNIRKAAKVINQLSPDEVYDQLIANLPYDETKNYLKKVTKRISLYEKHTS